MKYNKLRGAVAMLLTLVMVAAMLPVTVYAADTDGGGPAAPGVYDVEEDATPDDTGGGDYAEGGEVEVTVRELYGSPENAPLFATQAATTGTIRWGTDMSYNQELRYLFNGHTSAPVKWFNGLPAYCIEPDKSAPGSGSSVDAEDYFDDDEVRLALAYPGMVRVRYYNIYSSVIYGFGMPNYG